MLSSEQILHHILEKLHILRQHQKRILFFEQFFIWAGVSASLFFVLILLENLFWFSSHTRQMLLSLVVTLSLLLFLAQPAILLFSLFFRKQHPGNEALAGKAGEAFPEIRDRLLNALQVYRSHSFSTSREFAAEALSQTYQRIRDLDMRACVSEKNLRFIGKRAGAVLTTFIIFLALPSQRNAVNRLVHPSQSFKRPAAFSLDILSEPNPAIQSEPISIRIQTTGEVPRQIDITYQEDAQDNQTAELKSPFEFSITSRARQMTLNASSSGVRADPKIIRLETRPMVRNLQVSLKPPSYTKRPVSHLEENTGSITALRGTRVETRIKSNKWIQDAILWFDDSTTVPLKSNGYSAEGFFKITKNSEYEIRITDSLGIANKNPIRYPVLVRPDLYPTVQITFPGIDVDLDERMMAPLVIEGEDDFGITRMEIIYWIDNPTSLAYSKDDTFRVQIPIDGEPANVIQHYLWKLDHLELYPEDRVFYCCRLFDNDRVSGPKSAQSRIYSVRLPSIEEIFQEMDDSHEEQFSALENMMEESKDILDRVEQLSEDLKAGREMTWEKKQRLNQALEDQKDLQETLETLQEKLDEMIDTFEKNDLISPETLEKYSELQALYQEIATPELQEALMKMQESMESISPEQLQQQMEQMTLNQEMIMRSLERTIELLKRVRAEQQMDEAVRRMEELMQMQENISNELSDANPSKADSLQQMQDQAAEKFKEMQDRLDSLSQDMKALSNMPNAAMDSLLSAMKQEQYQQRADSLNQQLQQGEMSEASERSDSMEQSLAGLMNQMQQVQQQMMGQQKEKVLQSMQRMTQKMIDMSQQQEQLMNETQDSNNSSEVAEKQQALQDHFQQVADSLFQMSKQTFAITPEIARSMGESQMEMNQSLQSLENGNSQQAAEAQSRAMGGLNKTVMALFEAMEQMSSGGSGSGSDAFMMGMQQLSARQMALNQQLMDMFNQGQLSLSDQAGMKRLASKQKAIQQQLKDLLDQYGDRPGLSGRLDQLIEEMDQVIEELNQNNPTRKTVERQNRILSHLLDSERSLEKQDYSRERESRRGENTRRRGPSAIVPDENQLRLRLKRELLRLQKEGYTPDYEQLIRQYFDALSRETVNNEQ